MPNIEEHKKIINELVEDLNEKLREGVIVQRQKIIGFIVSEASANLFAILLHKKNLIDPGYDVNHNFFVSTKRANEAFSFDFPKKAKVIGLLTEVEDYRNKLCYGKDKSPEIVKEAIRKFFELKEFIEKEIGEDI